MKISINTLHYDNIDNRLVESHKKVMKHFAIPVNYNCCNINHGLWMDTIIENVTADIYVFFDIDCVPVSKEAYDETLQYVIDNNTFIGNAQVSNHIEPRTHIFAAPSFFAISRDCYYKLNKPSFCETSRSDIAEEVSYVAESMQVSYRCLYPTKFDKVSETDGIWRLSDRGVFGIGTLFENKFYHLFQARFKKNVELFERRCREIVSTGINTKNMHNCITFLK